MTRVVHIIVGLGLGGAESMLLKLLRGSDCGRTRAAVVSLMPGGELAPAVAELGVPVHTLGLRRGRMTPAALWRLRGLGRELRPDVVMGWMYHGNLAATALARLAPGRADLLWNIRHSVYDIRREGRLTRAVIRLGGRLSGQPRRIVFNSAVSIGQHTALGYPVDKAVMIPNGFATDVYRPDPAAGARLRAELGAAPGDPLVGIVGRFDPHKGHAQFLEAARAVQERTPAARFVLVGLGLEAPPPELVARVERFAAPERLHWLGLRRDVPALMAGLDVLASTSRSEGFPNVLGEGMCCGLPCVATRVGETEILLGDTGRVVDPGRPDLVADAILELLMLPAAERQALGARARHRIEAGYSLPDVVARYTSLLAGEDAETPA